MEVCDRHKTKRMCDEQYFLKSGRNRSYTPNTLYNIKYCFETSQLSPFFETRLTTGGMSPFYLPMIPVFLDTLTDKGDFAKKQTTLTVQSSKETHKISYSEVLRKITGLLASKAQYGCLTSKECK